MKRAFRIPSLITAVLLVGACQQIIGLSDYETGDEDEEGGGSGRGGTNTGGASGGSGGKAGKGGAAGSSTGGKGGTGGKGATGGTSGEAGEGGMGADGGTGGASGGNAGRGGSSGSGGSTAGGGGSGGKSNCPTIIVQEAVGMSIKRDEQSAVYNLAIQQQLVGTAEDFISVQFYAGTTLDGQATGTFEIGTGIDDNFETCARCLLVERDSSGVGFQGNTRFLATSGTLEIANSSEQMEGRPSLTLSNVTFVEVTIDPDTYVSTPVANGGCYHVASSSLELPTPAWECPVSSWGDNICDCGCDTVDFECGNPYIGPCAVCDSPGSCATSCDEIDWNDSSQCAATDPTWTCPITSYGDGACTCGCGSVDPECASDYVGPCTACEAEGGCTMGGDCTLIDLNDNSTCHAGTSPWTCLPAYYGAGDGCDCGCGVVDPDCASDLKVDTCFCGTGSCSPSGCADIEPTNNAVCLAPPGE